MNSLESSSCCDQPGNTHPHFLCSSVTSATPTDHHEPQSQTMNSQRTHNPTKRTRAKYRMMTMMSLTASSVSPTVSDIFNQNLSTSTVAFIQRHVHVRTFTTERTVTRECVLCNKYFVFTHHNPSKVCQPTRLAVVHVCACNARMCISDICLK